MMQNKALTFCLSFISFCKSKSRMKRFSEFLQPISIVLFTHKGSFELSAASMLCSERCEGCHRGKGTLCLQGTYHPNEDKDSKWKRWRTPCHHLALFCINQ